MQSQLAALTLDLAALKSSQDEAGQVIRILERSGARQSKFDKHGGRSKLVKGRFEIDMDEFGVDRDVIRTSSTRSIR